ncbi:MAG TPA: GNVR domain-containing protein [Burkholderiaceae bacterium]|jgi:uncharacterized protein involved in exopolysaccharide biosynthesis
MTIPEFSERIQSTSLQNEDGVSLIDVITAIGEEKRTIFGFAIFFTLIGLIVSLSLPNVFTAKTTFLPPQQNQSGAASALASLGGLAGLAGGSLGIKSPDELYVAFLQSDTLQNNLIQQFKLQSLYEKKTLGDTRKVLKANVKTIADKKSGIVSIEVDDSSPILAAQIANAYVEELRKLLDRLAVTDAQQRRVFFEKLIAKTKDALALAELESKKAQETSGVVSLDAQTAAAIKASAELRAQIALREVQIRAMSSYATSQNADVQRLVAELAGLRAELEKLEHGTGQDKGSDKSVGALANLRAFREVKYQEAVLDTLVKQYELARVEEAKEGPLIQQVDVAVPPEKKSKPNRSIIVIMAMFGGLMIGLIVAFMRRRLKMAITDPALAENIRIMFEAWGLRKKNI